MSLSTYHVYLSTYECVLTVVKYVGYCGGCVQKLTMKAPARRLKSM